MSEAKVKCNELLQKLINTQLDILLHYRLYCNLHDELAEHPKVAENYSAFFMHTIKAHQLAVVIQTWTFFDKNPKSCTIHSLVKQVKECESLDRDKMQTVLLLYEDTLTEHKKLISNLHAQRHNFFAHRDSKSTSNLTEFMKRFPIPFDDFDALLDRIGTILNHCNVLLTGTHTVFEMEHIDESTELISDLDRLLKYDEESIGSS